jgi:hypothetical protein
VIINGIDFTSKSLAFTWFVKRHQCMKNKIDKKGSENKLSQKLKLPKYLPNLILSPM